MKAKEITEHCIVNKRLSISNLVELDIFKKRAMSVIMDKFEIDEEVVAEAKFNVEVAHFKSRFDGDANYLLTCSPLSAFETFLKCMSDKLSFSKTPPLLVDLIPRSGVVNYAPTGYGLAEKHMKQGSLDGYLEPVIVYEGDDFKANYVNGVLRIEHHPDILRINGGAKRIAVYVTLIVKGKYRPILFTKREIESFLDKSIEQATRNSKTDQDKEAKTKSKTDIYDNNGMWKSKALLHALRRFLGVINDDYEAAPNLNYQEPEPEPNVQKELQPVNEPLVLQEQDGHPFDSPDSF